MNGGTTKISSYFLPAASTVFDCILFLQFNLRTHANRAVRIVARNGRRLGYSAHFPWLFLYITIWRYFGKVFGFIFREAAYRHFIDCKNWTKGVK
jgi:hypothetical protein